MTDNWQTFGQIFGIKKTTVKPPSYEWQDLALQIITELRVPKNKRNSVFKVCKQYSPQVIKQALIDTKELATGERWKYFFKVVTCESPSRTSAMPKALNALRDPAGDSQVKN